MEAKSEEIPTVTLSPFKFTDWLKVPDAATEDSGAKNVEPKSNHVPSQSYWGLQPPLDYRRPEAYERMAADKTGEELAHDATIWKLYLEEAEEHDQELVKSRHGSLDMLLLFAALFSAILTAFIIESKDLLQQNPADASAALLLLVLQSQQRIELGIPSPVDTPLDELPTFIPSAAARWINGIWFTSLALSLSAALIAMLGKEWLTAYLASRPRPAHSHALLRQARLEGLEDWWALHIIALLPSLLHASLFLFSIGLVIYLWMLDTVVTGMIVGITGITSLFYIVTAILGAIYEHCPFVTQVSGYIKRAFDRYLRRQLQSEDRSGITSMKDLQALLWLANNARDPVVVDCSFQALAGLRWSSEKTKPSNPNNYHTNDILPNELQFALPMQINAETTSLSLFHIVIERYERAIANPLLSSIADGLTLARYAAAMVRLFNYLPSVKEDDAARDGPNGENFDIIGKLETNNQPVHATPKFKKSPNSADILNLLEGLWENNGPSFSTNAYAGFLTAQMELLSSAASFRGHGRDVLSRAPMERPFSLTNGLAAITSGAHVLEIAVKKSELPHFQGLASLRACYSRSLCRISYLLWLNSDKKIKVEASALIRLLEALRTTAGCEELNPEDSISTHHPQGNSSAAASPFSFGISAVNANKWSFDANDLYLGPLGSLIDLLRAKLDITEESLLRARTVAVEAFSVLAPILLQQVLRLDRAELRRQFNLRNWSGWPAPDMEGIRYIAARQMFLTLRHLGPTLHIADEVPSFVLNALFLIDSYIKDGEDSGVDGARFATKCHGGDLSPLLEFASISSSNLGMISDSIMFRLIDLVRLTLPPLCQTSLSPACFPALIAMIGPAEASSGSVKEMLQSMVSRIRNGPVELEQNTTSSSNSPSIDYLNYFTHSDKGFSSFVAAATSDECREVVMDAIAEFVHLATNRHEVFEGASVELDPSAVPGLLDVVSLLAEYCSGNSERQKLLLDFSQDVIRLFEVISEDPESRELVTRHGASNDLFSALDAIDEKEAALEKLDQVRRLRLKMGITNTEQTAPIVESEAEDSGVEPPADKTAPESGNSDQSRNNEVAPSTNKEGDRNL